MTAAREAALWRDDRLVLQWLADTRDLLEAKALALRSESIALQVRGLGLEDPSAVVAGVIGMLHMLPADRQEAVIATLRREVLFGAHGSLPMPGLAAGFNAPSPMAAYTGGGGGGAGGMPVLGSALWSSSSARGAGGLTHGAVLPPPLPASHAPAGVTSAGTIQFMLPTR